MSAKKTSKKTKPTVKHLPRESLLAFAKNSVGSAAYKNYFAFYNGSKSDLVGGGSSSCAFFISNALRMFGSVREGHLTVDSTVVDLIKCGAVAVGLRSIEPGDVLIWAKRNNHKHIGFYVGQNQAISTSAKTRRISKHHYTYGGSRKIEAAFRPKFA
jgi:hypothetical protein